MRTLQRLIWKERDATRHHPDRRADHGISPMRTRRTDGEGEWRRLGIGEWREGRGIPLDTKRSSLFFLSPSRLLRISDPSLSCGRSRSAI